MVGISKPAGGGEQGACKQQLPRAWKRKMCTRREAKVRKAGPRAQDRETRQRSRQGTAEWGIARALQTLLTLVSFQLNKIQKGPNSNTGSQVPSLWSPQSLNPKQFIFYLLPTPFCLPLRPCAFLPFRTHTPWRQGQGNSSSCSLTCSQHCDSAASAW